MNNTLKSLLLVIVSFALGYNLYPAINSASLEKSHNENASVPQQQIKANTEQTTNTRDNNNQQTVMASTVEKAVTVETSNNDTVVIESESSYSTHKTNEQEKENQPANNLSPEQTELLSWTKEHKEQLLQVIDDNFPESIKSSMKSTLEENNPFLNEPELRQDQDIDNNWAYLMEQDIKTLISQHELGKGVEVLQVTCKQLRCDMLVIENQGNVWWPIYSSLFALPNVKFPKDNSTAVNVSRIENGLFYIYSQLDFNAS